MKNIKEHQANVMKEMIDDIINYMGTDEIYRRYDEYLKTNRRISLKVYKRAILRFVIAKDLMDEPYFRSIIISFGTREMGVMLRTSKKNIERIIYMLKKKLINQIDKEDLREDVYNYFFGLNGKASTEDIIEDMLSSVEENILDRTYGFN